MTTFRDVERFRGLVDNGLLRAEELDAIGESAARRDVEVEQILRYECLFTRRTILKALAEYYQCGFVEYDERVPVPPELFAGLDPDRLGAAGWFPVAREGEKIVIAAWDPSDPLMMEEVKELLPAPAYEFRVALNEEVLFFIRDFLNGPPDHLIGNERTGLAFWRNTMARWRTKLACYRTDFASARTFLSALRGGLMLITIGAALLRLRSQSSLVPLYWLSVVLGILFVVVGLYSYFRIKKSRLRPPKHETLIEVTAATMHFLENYQFIEERPPDRYLKKTMLCRLADLLPNSCVRIDSSLDHKVRSSLAHERNSLAAQRTVLGCYRTLFSRARTGFSFIRTGISFASIGIGFIEYFGLSRLTILDVCLITAGVAMAVDGIIWSWPVRNENREGARCGFIS